MSSFDKVIGYEDIKQELLQICDMLRNPEIYTAMGAKLPHGIMLEGDPGLGKTLLASCFIRESGLKAYTLRRTKSDGGFIDEITDTFFEAKHNAPSVIFLDDMDKFANEDIHHVDAEEYVAVQAGIDEVKDCGVVVIATVNNSDKLPDSLIRPGRFDRRLCVMKPNEEDSERIIRHFLEDKRLSDNVIMEDIVGIFAESSCAELETILNEAAIYAAFKRHDRLETEDIVRAFLKNEYRETDSGALSGRERRRAALHEAGHVLVSEALNRGSVGMASIRAKGNGNKGGFVNMRKSNQYSYFSELIAVAGLAACENEPYPETGCRGDLEMECYMLTRRIQGGGCGLSLVYSSCEEQSESKRTRIETAFHSELEKNMLTVRHIISENRTLLNALAEELLSRGTLLSSEISRLIREYGLHSPKLLGEGGNFVD